MKSVNIKVIGPDYRGAPQPKFSEKCFNESMILDGERAKECRVYFDTEKNVGRVEWLTQESEKISPEFLKETLRVFKAVGAPRGSKIEIRYGIRDGGWMECKKYSRTVR